MPFSTVQERSGSLSAVGYTKETTFGQPLPAVNFLPSMSCTLEHDPGWFSPEVMTNVRDLQIYNLAGEAKNIGAVEGPLFPTQGIGLLAGSIGTDVVTGTVAPYTHTISTATLLPSFTVEKNVGGFQSEQYAGCRIGKMTLKCAASNTPVQITADLTGQSVTILSTPTAVTEVNELPFVFTSAALTVFGHLRSEATNVQIVIDNGLKETYTFSGQNGPNFITPASLKVNGSFDVVFSSLNDPTYGDFTTMANQTLGALSLVFTVGANVCTISLPQIVISKYATPLKVGDVIVATVDFQASRPLTGGSQYTIQAVVNNSVATAY